MTNTNPETSYRIATELKRSVCVVKYIHNGWVEVTALGPDAEGQFNDSFGRYSINLRYLPHQLQADLLNGTCREFFRQTEKTGSNTFKVTYEPWCLSALCG